MFAHREAGDKHPIVPAQKNVLALSHQELPTLDAGTHWGRDSEENEQ